MSRWSGKAKKLEIDAAGRAPVDRDAHACDERGSCRYEEAHEIGDVLGRRDALQRVVLYSLRTLLIYALAGDRGLRCEKPFPARRRGRGRRHRVHENSGRTAEIGEPLREVDES